MEIKIKDFIYVIILVLAVFPVVMACLLSIACGVSPFYNGYAVDSKGILYIGKDSAIVKYSDGKEIGRISPQTSRGYSFTVQEDDTVLVSTAPELYLMDTSGNILEEHEKTDAKTRSRLNTLKRKKVFTTASGDKYVMRSPFLRTTICLGDKIVYRMPVNEYLVKIGLLYCIVVFNASMPIILLIFLKRKK